MHAIVGFPFAVAGFAIAVTWWAGTLGGLGYPLYQWALPPLRGPDGVSACRGTSRARRGGAGEHA